MRQNNVVSESRTYVMACRKMGEPGYYFRKFTLPEGLANDAEYASFYFLTRLDRTAAIGEIYSFEDFSNITEAQEP